MKSAEVDDVIDSREAHRVQSELLRILHAEGEARTRVSDAPKRSVLDAAVPFVVGVLIGALGTYAGISARIAVLETVQVQTTKDIAEVLRIVRAGMRYQQSVEKP